MCIKVESLARRSRSVDDGNDDSFVTRLHCAYLESINTRLGLRD
ncbi:hypothetical protein WUBG_16143 [Wuchereria bancrofti]|uniref:Uncharacterized protein n=1 Tax=Wuchereria bancrofti TaxID=6293 RepID=J9AFV7_WUCBA|nr:hypothetical protein WUBG_16143 [Wuchereria bancrofti]